MRFLAACLSLKEWDAGVVLRYSEQSAMELVIERVSFSSSPLSLSFSFLSRRRGACVCVRSRNTSSEEEKKPN